MKIGDNQIKLLNLINNYLHKISSLGIDVAASGFCWILNVPAAPGYLVLKNFHKKKILDIKNLFFIFKNIIGLSILHNYKLLHKINLDKDFNRLIISIARKDDFLSDGSYFDRYFNINSRHDPKSMWFLLSLDEVIPKNIDKNIVVFGKENIKRKYSFIYFLKVLLFNIKISKGSLIKIFHLSLRSSHFSIIASKSVTKIVKSKNFKTILMAYEAQPFQNTIFKEIKKLDNNVKLVGYLCSTLSLPSYSFYRYGAPDLLLVHSSDQIYHLEKYLNWPSDRLRLVPSLRHSYKKSNKYNNSLVLPTDLPSNDLLIKKFELFLNYAEKKSLKPLSVQNHPLMNNSKKHKKFINNLNNLILHYSDRFYKNAKKDISIFFGGTATALEALESGFNVIHICTDSVLESFSDVFWPSIKVRQIEENIFEYSLRSYGKCINFGNEDNKNKFNKYYTL